MQTNRSKSLLRQLRLLLWTFHEEEATTQIEGNHRLGSIVHTFIEILLNTQVPTHYCNTIEIKNKAKNITFSLFWADFFLFAYHLNILFLQFLFASLSLRLFLKQSTSFGAKWLRIRNHFTLPWAPAPTTSRVLIAGPRPRPVWCVPGCVAAPRGITAVPAGSTWAYTAVHNFRYPLKKDHRIRIIITQ